MIKDQLMKQRFNLRFIYKSIYFPVLFYAFEMKERERRYPKTNGHLLEKKEEGENGLRKTGN